MVSSRYFQARAPNSRVQGTEHPLGRSTDLALSRATARVVALSGLTAGLYCLWLAGDLALTLRPQARRVWRLAAMRRWAKSVASLAGMRIVTRGIPPKQPFMAVATPLGYMDVAALSSLGACVYAAKSDVARWPATGRLCRSMRMIFVDRERRGDVGCVGRAILSAIGEGGGGVL